MCRTVHALLQSAICAIQMLVRVFMTVILMLENLVRMILQTLYNFISFILQMLSLIPICVVFLLTARLKCFMCGGGGPCPVNRGGTCDCLMSAVAIIILFFIFRATGVLDKIFYSIGYAKAYPDSYTAFVPTPGDVTECSRNDTEVFYDDYATTAMTGAAFVAQALDMATTPKPTITATNSTTTEPTTTEPITTKPTTTEPITTKPTTTEPTTIKRPEGENDALREHLNDFTTLIPITETSTKDNVIITPTRSFITVYKLMLK